MDEFNGITRPGKYRMRNGIEVEVEPYLEGSYKTWAWKKVGELDGTSWAWQDNGSWGGNKELDIIAGPLTDDAELAGLTGFICLTESGAPRAGLFGTIDSAHQYICANDDRVLDLSTIRKDQLVPLEPKQETVMCRFWAYEGGTIICRRNDENSYPGGGTGRLLSHWEQEITFTHGQSLGDAP